MIGLILELGQKASRYVVTLAKAQYTKYKKVPEINRPFRGMQSKKDFFFNMGFLRHSVTS
jgi:hypothetical protein